MGHIESLLHAISYSFGTFYRKRSRRLGDRNDTAPRRRARLARNGRSFARSGTGGTGRLFLRDSARLLRCGIQALFDARGLAPREIALPTACQSGSTDDSGNPPDQAGCTWARLRLQALCPPPSARLPWPFGLPERSRPYAARPGRCGASCGLPWRNPLVLRGNAFETRIPSLPTRADRPPHVPRIYIFSVSSSAFAQDSAGRPSENILILGRATAISKSETRVRGAYRPACLAARRSSRRRMRSRAASAAEKRQPQ